MENAYNPAQLYILTILLENSFHDIGCVDLLFSPYNNVIKISVDDWMTCCSFAI